MYWDFNEALFKGTVHDQIFDLYTAQLQNQGLIVNAGSIIDAPILRINKDENAQIKGGKGAPKEWSENKKR